MNRLINFSLLKVLCLCFLISDAKSTLTPVEWEIRDQKLSQIGNADKIDAIKKIAPVIKEQPWIGVNLEDYNSIEDKLLSPITAVVEANFVDFAVGRAGMTYKPQHYMALLESNIVAFIKIMREERSDAELAAYQAAKHLGIGLVPPSVRLESIPSQLETILPKLFRHNNASYDTCLIQYFVSGRSVDESMKKYVNADQESQSVILRALLGHGDMHTGNRMIAWETKEGQTVTKLALIDNESIIDDLTFDGHVFTGSPASHMNNFVDNNGKFDYELITKIKSLNDDTWQSFFSSEDNKLAEKIQIITERQAALLLFLENKPYCLTNAK